MSDKMNEMMKDITGKYYQNGMKAGQNNEKKSTAMKMIADGESNERVTRYTGLTSAEIIHLKSQKTSF